MFHLLSVIFKVRGAVLDLRGPISLLNAAAGRVHSHLKWSLTSSSYLWVQTRPALPPYLLGQALRVLQAVRERLDQEVAAALAQSTVVSALLAGVREESQPHLRHRVAAGLLPEQARQGGGYQDAPRTPFIFLPLFFTS